MQWFISNALSKDLEVLPANKKLELVSNGNCTILPVDLCCMKFRHRLMKHYEKIKHVCLSKTT